MVKVEEPFSSGQPDLPQPQTKKRGRPPGPKKTPEETKQYKQQQMIDARVRAQVSQQKKTAALSTAQAIASIER